MDIKRNYFKQTIPGVSSIFEHSAFNEKNNKLRKNDDGSVSSTLSITITDPMVNNGMPTLIPSLYDGAQLPQNVAIQRALKSGKTWPSFRSIEEANKIAGEISDLMGSE